MVSYLTQLNDDSLVAVLRQSCVDLDTTICVLLVCKRLNRLCNDRYIWTNVYLNFRLQCAHGPASIHTTDALKQFIRRWRRLDHNLSSGTAKIVSLQVHPFAQAPEDTPSHAIIYNFIFIVSDTSMVKCYDMDRAMEAVWEYNVLDVGLEGEVSIKAALHMNGGVPGSLVRTLISGEMESVVATFQLGRTPVGEPTLTAQEPRLLPIGRSLGNLTQCNEWLLPGYESTNLVVNTDTGKVCTVQLSPNFWPQTSLVIDSSHFVTLLCGPDGCILATYELPAPDSPNLAVLEVSNYVHVPHVFDSLAMLEKFFVRCGDDKSVTPPQEVFRLFGQTLSMESESPCVTMDVSLPSAVNSHPTINCNPLSINVGDHTVTGTKLGQHGQRVYGTLNSDSDVFILFQVPLVKDSASGTYSAGSSTLLELSKGWAYVLRTAFDEIRGRLYLLTETEGRLEVRIQDYV